MSRAARFSHLLILVLLTLAGTAQALVHFDFEQKYFVHPGRQVWDFSIVRPDSVYHIFYHTIHETTPQASYADTIWHASSLDLKNWTIEDPVLTVGQGYWDEGAMWAPDVFFDEAGQRWMMAYTACDSRMNQRIAMATSDDLYTWTKVPHNPVVVPEPGAYVWNPEGWWSDFRDPQVVELDGLYHMLVTAKKNFDGEGTGVLYHGVSLDLENWTDVGTPYINDGEDFWRVPESPQYKQMWDKEILYFGEYDTGGISVIAGDFFGDWSMDHRQWIDYGYAPEVKEFDPGIPIFARIAPFDTPSTGLRSYVVRLDTLVIGTDGHIDPYQPVPLEEQWASWSGSSNLAQPTYGDNPAARGDEPAGIVGHGFYGSKEYYQGPLSGRGSPGTQLGDAATGILESYPFTITGTRMTLLVGGGYYPETCYVALVDAAADTIIYTETGNNQELMTLRQWNLAPLQSYEVVLRIVDQENQPFGHINVDEIREDNQTFSPVTDEENTPARLTLRHKAWPNPFNPSTTISFDLPADTELTVKIHDLRGRLVWTSGVRQYGAGTGKVTWQGQGLDGTTLPTGTYLYRLDGNGQNLGSGKISLVK
nr:FlgD immunoglobulin-like domain containing protein [Candidatus Krumholzibacteria bacterium]